jgi:uncharacterized protein YjiS (DUF1127 family)
VIRKRVVRAAAAAWCGGSQSNEENNIMSAMHWMDHAGSPRTAGRFAGLLGLIGEWLRRSESRRELAGLCDHALRDIGITRVDALREADKPFWRG